MNDLKGVLIKIASQILMSCPISTYEEDWHFPKSLSKRQRFLIQERLDKLDSWLKAMCIKVRDAADTIEAAPSASNNTQSAPFSMPVKLDWPRGVDLTKIPGGSLG